MEALDKKIKELKDFIKEKTDQGTANYLGKEIREICGMVETEQLPIQRVVLSAYYVNPMGEPIIVLAENIADACDKLDKAGIKDYIFVHQHSFDVVH